MSRRKRQAVVGIMAIALAALSASAYADDGANEDRSCVGHYPLVVCWPPW